MTSSNEDQYRRREQDLKERELNIRLRELEHEIEKTHQPSQEPVAEPARSVEVVPEPSPGQRKKKALVRKLMNFGKFLCLVAVGLATYHFLHWISMVVIVGALGFLGYVLFLKK